nr:PREDICTED: uncharacterized protein LOC100552244 [Anolis carolinensis]|eukprot:XP_003215149.1 PREDICTED: uncharacterized protein LOC100552244 [Anolis carolinensis]
MKLEGMQGAEGSPEQQRQSPGRMGTRRKRHLSPSGSGSTSSSECDECCYRRICRRKGKRKARRSNTEEMSDCKDRGNYWLAGAHIPSLPTWAIKRRKKTARRKGSGKEGEGSTPYHNDNFPGLLLDWKVRERILNGRYVDVFALNPDLDEGKEIERSFHNWLAGYTVFMGVVAIAYPERGWHLINHLSNVLKAMRVAGEAAAIDYDTAFRQRASNSSHARWDLLNTDLWLVCVLPKIKRKSEGRTLLKRVRKKDPRKRVCWKFNDGECHRECCKFEHYCENCLGPHPKLHCMQLTGEQEQFEEVE